MKQRAASTKRSRPIPRTRVKRRTRILRQAVKRANTNNGRIENAARGDSASGDSNG